jgi:ankyrin repeat protein
MSAHAFTWQTEDQEHTANIDGAEIRWATVTDAYDDDRPYTGETGQKQTVADFLATGPAERAPTAVIEQMLAAVNGGRAVPWLAPLRLQQAAAAGDVAATRKLLKEGAPPDVVVRGRTALTAALESEQLEAVAALLEGGSKPNVRVEGGATALHVAARNAKSAAWIGVLRALLAAGADPEARAADGQTPLLAGLRGHLGKEGVEVLVASHKAVNTPAEDGSTPLLAEARGWSALLWAITKHDAWFVKMLIDAGADVKVVGQPHKQGQSPKSALALAESFVGAKDLADAGAQKGRAPALAAQIVELLRAAGARA